MSSTALLGVLSTATTKLDKTEEFRKFLLESYPHAQGEPQTAQWYGMKFKDAPNKYAVFDTFQSEEGRSAYLSGKLAAALEAISPEIVPAGPTFNKMEILASVVRTEGLEKAGVKGGLNMGLRVLATVKPDKVKEAREFFLAARAHVWDEPESPIWYAIHWEGTNQYGIIDAFVTDDAKEFHLAGKVATALFGEKGKEIFVETPNMIEYEVVAAKV